MPERDCYDYAVAYFLDHPEQITPNWFDPTGYGCLFRFLTPDGFTAETGELHGNQRLSYGCPVLISQRIAAFRDNPTLAEGHWRPPYVAPCQELTDLVASSDIPDSFCSMFPHVQTRHLEAFAIVQRAADKLIPNRQVPQCPPYTSKKIARLHDSSPSSSNSTPSSSS